VLYGDQAIEQFKKRLSSVVTVKSGRVEHLDTVFKITNLLCND